MKTALLFSIAAALVQAAPSTTVPLISARGLDAEIFDKYDSLEWYLSPAFGGHQANATVTSDHTIADRLKVKFDALFGTPPQNVVLEDDEEKPGIPMSLGEARMLSQEEFDAWKEPAHFAAVSYCLPKNIETWSCGSHCEALGDAQVVALGGEDDETPFWFIAVAGSKAYVSVQGTSKKLESIINDLQILHVDASETYFPGSNGARIHDGFYDGFIRMGRKVTLALSSVVEQGITDIVVTGHSQGAAVAQILAVGLQNFLPKATISARVFAPPRTGDTVWADYVDAKLGDRSQFMLSANDPVPHIPPPHTVGAQYRHSSNEVWVQDVNGTTAIACPGQESEHCSTPLFWDSTWKLLKAIVQWRTKTITTHRGPFSGVRIQCDEGK